MDSSNRTWYSHADLVFLIGTVISSKSPTIHYVVFFEDQRLLTVYDDTAFIKVYVFSTGVLKAFRTYQIQANVVYTVVRAKNFRIAKKPTICF